MTWGFLEIMIYGLFLHILMFYIVMYYLNHLHYIAVDSLLTERNRCNRACSWKAFAIVRVSIEPEDVAHLKAMTWGSVGKQSVSVLSGFTKKFCRTTPIPKYDGCVSN